MEIQSKESAPTLSDDLNVITAEINAYKRVAGEAIFEIGRRLKHVKENDLTHGQWSKWCDAEIGMDRAQADKFIRVYDEIGGNECTYTQLGLRALYEIATLPSEERDRPHTIPSTGEIKSVDEMTVRELREVKRALKAERESRELAERQRDEALESAQVLRDTIESISASSDGEVIEIRTGSEISGRSLEFSASVRDFLKKYSFLTHFDVEFSTLNECSAKEYQTAIDGMYDFLDGISKMLPSRRSRESIIIEAD
ncbi:DUF3102 domain-containing protein [Brevibacillus laterosporus]|uniref:DUF3102 domain-containing protein n=1 Tax=Brevibacillus laterosporus TaxID=1465 RepID=UPI001F41BD42|nr:DUF3102 domain-containing protein [Brevibacillus laterosporus]